MELFRLTVAEAARLVAAREVSSVELTRAVLERTESTEARIAAYVTVLADEALAAAAAADATAPRGPLHGVPVALKDLIDVTGVPTRAGSRARADAAPAAADATVTRRLRAAGAVIVGKTVTQEFAVGPFSPPARNPWDTGRIPGGSSGGSAAVVAADSCLAAIGTDTGGSIRNPASLCGVAGLKPTYGRVSTAGVFPLAPSHDHVGPIAKTAQDCALLLQAIAGRDADDRCSAREAVPDFSAGLGSGLAGLRIGVPRNHFFDRIEADVEHAVRNAIAVLGDEGADLVAVDLPHVELGVSIVRLCGLVEAAAVHRQSLRERGELYAEPLRCALEAGALVCGADYVHALRLRALVQRSVAEAYERSRLDLLVTPSTPLTALPVGQESCAVGGGSEEPAELHYMRFAAVFDVTGQPALSVPCGFDGAGLPIGLQLVGRPFAEATVLRAGHAYEQATDWHRRDPLL